MDTVLFDYDNVDCHLHDLVMPSGLWKVFSISSIIQLSLLGVSLYVEDNFMKKICLRGLSVPEERLDRSSACSGRLRSRSPRLLLDRHVDFVYDKLARPLWRHDVGRSLYSCVTKLHTGDCIK